MTPAEAELKALQAMARAAEVMVHQVAQGRGVGFFSNLKYKMVGSVKPDLKPLPPGQKPPP